METIDILSRDDYVKYLKEIIGEANKDSYKKTHIIELDGSWGSGKSFILQKLIDQEKDNFIFFTYNAWENDYYDEPLVGLLYCLAKELNRINKLHNIVNGVSKKIIKGISDLFINLGNALIKNKTGIDFKKIYKEINNGVKDVLKDEEIDLSFNDKTILEITKSSVKKALEIISYENKIVIIVDEVDRCLPEYGLKVLERLHHLLVDIPNVQAIVANNRDAFKKMIISKYGFDEADANIYFDKFFDHSLLVNEGNLSDTFNDKYNSYVSMFNKIEIIKDEDIKTFRSELFNMLDIRTVDKSIVNACLIHNSISDKSTIYDKSVECFEILTSCLMLYCKHKNMKLTSIESLFHGKCNPSQIIFFGENKDNKMLEWLICRFDKQNFFYSKTNYETKINVTSFWSAIWYYCIKIFGNGCFTKYKIQSSNGISAESNVVYLQKFYKELRVLYGKIG